MIIRKAYLNNIKHFRVIDSNGRNMINVALITGNVNNSIFSMTGLSFHISQRKPSESLSSSLMPSTLKTMATCKIIDSKTIHLLSKIFSAMSISIPTSNNKSVSPISQLKGITGNINEIKTCQLIT